MDDEMICPELQGMILIEDTGEQKEWPWIFTRCLTHDVRINRSAYRLAFLNGIEDWRLADDWGGTAAFEDDDGRAICVMRVDSGFRTLIFATSEAFWIKMVLKYR